jgi:hypothetical protein
MSGCTDLVTINLKGNDIHDEGASHVAKTLYFIERLHLNLSENPIGVTGTSYMFQAVKETTILKTLILIGGTIIADLLPVKNAQEIATGLRATSGRGVLWILDDFQPRLHTVFFSTKHTECSIIVTSRHIIDEITNGKSKPLLVSLLHCLHEAQDPALCLYVAERLEYKLFLENSNLKQKDVLSIARMLYLLEHLYMSHNRIGDTGASLISEAVRETATLKTLILYNCGITSRGAEDLSRALAQNSSLEKLDIGWNSVGDEGISHVAEALKQNKQLKELWISKCGMTDKGAASLASALTVNTSLKMLNIGESNGPLLTEGGLSAIADSLANKSMFVKLTIPYVFGSVTADHLSWKINKARRRNGLPPIEIEGEYSIVCCVDVSFLFCYYTFVCLMNLQWLKLINTAD